eukprot:276531-Chlamydomonas_euryale.AAC.2
MLAAPCLQAPYGASCLQAPYGAPCLQAPYGPVIVSGYTGTACQYRDLLGVFLTSSPPNGKGGRREGVRIIPDRFGSAYPHGVNNFAKALQNPHLHARRPAPIPHLQHAALRRAPRLRRRKSRRLGLALSTTLGHSAHTATHQLRAYNAAPRRASTPPQIKTVSISLHGMLDYDVDDDDEPTVELSMFAELFMEMLVRELGANIATGLLRGRMPAAGGGKRARDDEGTGADCKRSRADSGGSGSVADGRDGGRKDGGGAGAAKGVAAQGAAAKDAAKPPVDTQLLIAF